MVARFICGDTLQEMVELEESTFDAVVTDPPYCSGGVSEASRQGAKSQGVKITDRSRHKWFSGDNMTTAGFAWLMREFAVQAYRLTKVSGSLLVFCDWRMVPTLAPAIDSAGFRYQNIIVWNKINIGMGTGFRAVHEMVLHFTAGAPAYHSKSVGNVITAGRVPPDRRINPTQKPVELMRKLLEVVAPAGGSVLDAFAGSGSTAAACVDLGIDFVGIEKDAAQVKLAEERVGKRRKL